MLQIMSGVMKGNPYLESFELVLLNGYNFLNVNNFIEGFEDYTIGNRLRKLTLRESFKFCDKTRFLEEGTRNLEELTVTKTILNQRIFKLDDRLRVMKLCPVNFATDSFEIGFEQFIFVLDQLQYNQHLTTFEIGIRHGNRKGKIFNPDLYEKERKAMTIQLASVLSKVFANNRRLEHLSVSYKHAHFEDSLKIAENLISSMRAGLNNIRSFNGFPIYDYVFYKLPRLSLCEEASDFDHASYDPLFCALVVKLVMLQEGHMKVIEFNPDSSALQELARRREEEALEVEY